MIHQDDAGLPHEIADRFTEPFARFLRVEAAAGALLLLATVAALILSNSAWSVPFLAFWEMPVGVHFGALDFSRSLRHWINDGLMTLFFFVIALELKRELALGELRNLRMAALPAAGALGGMLVPAALYLALMNGQPGIHGWGTVMATDTAFVIGCLALFGPRIPPSLRLFLLSLAIFDDVGAIVVVAVVYGDALNWLAVGLGLFGLSVVASVAFIGIRSIPIFFLLGGMVWLCFDASGIHPTIAGVILGLMTPTRGWVSDERLRVIFGRVLSYPIGDHWSGDTTERSALQRAGAAASETLSPVERLEIMLHPWVGFAIMPIFAIANAGVSLSVAKIDHSVSAAIVAGLVLGKPVGVLSFSWLAVRFGLATFPLRLSWPLLAAGSFLTGIGFTMSLFIAGLAFDSGMLGAAKIGVIAGSAVSAAAGLLMLTWLTFRKPIA
jgi:NhaA family Na+:H+ antiporter